MSLVFFNSVSCVRLLIAVITSHIQQQFKVIAKQSIIEMVWVILLFTPHLPVQLSRSSDRLLFQEPGFQKKKGFLFMETEHKSRSVNQVQIRVIFLFDSYTVYVEVQQNFKIFVDY